MFHDLNQLFVAAEIPCDETGCLGHVSEMLTEFGPSLILLAGCSAQVIAVDQIGLATHGEEAAEVAARLEEGLRTQRACFFEYSSGKGARLAFGVRLSPLTVGSVLGGLVFPEERAREGLAAWVSALVTCGNLAWQVLDERAAEKRMKARKDQLRIEHDTLRSAHVKALAQALEEQQKRIAAEKDASQRLEQQVEIRSAELRQALEDATRKSQELREYSIALENANIALEQFIREADAANRAKSQFLAMVSHEVRTPMSAILGYTDLLLDEFSPSGTPREYLDIIRRNGAHLMDVINDILNLSKIEAGKLDVKPTRFSLRQLVEDACSLMDVRAKSKGLVLSTEYPDRLPEAIETDRTWLNQILVNLIGNAVKFTQAGRITVTCRYLPSPNGEPRVVLKVADTGIGIPEDKIAQIFEPFTQLDSSFSRSYGGTGLGLTISKKLVASLGGEMTVESQLGQGSVFRVSIPVKEATAPTDPEECRQAPSGDASPAGARSTSAGWDTVEALRDRRDCKILLVEDSADNQRLLSTILKIAGAEVTLAGNGQAAIDIVYPQARASKHRGVEQFDLILMDMQMPVLDGYAATRILRQRGCTTPIVALTAHAMAGEREKCAEVGCDDYLSKPIDRPSLLAMVRQYVPPRQEAAGGARETQA
jgi:signal transduction histidine kinase/FixJ family two-component response regulator